jgi:hypothetical protein
MATSLSNRLLALRQIPLELIGITALASFAGPLLAGFLAWPLWAMLALAVLPWLNPRFVLVSGGLALLAVVVVWRIRSTGARSGGGRNGSGQDGRAPRGATLAAAFGLLLGPLVVSALALRWYQLAIHGSSLAVADQYEGFFIPTTIDGRLGMDVQGFLVALAGLFVDRQYGLLVFAPIYVLAVVGLVALWRYPGYRWMVIALGVIAVPYVALTADFRVWWGGWSPPARYLAVLTPLLAAPLARSLLAMAGNRPYHVVFVAFGGVGILAAAVLLLQLGDPDVEQAIFSNPSRNPAMVRWLVLRFGTDLPQLLPATASWFGDRRIPIPWAQIVGYLALLSALVGVAVLRLPRPRQSGRKSSAVAQGSESARAVGVGAALTPAYAEAVSVAEPTRHPPAGHVDTRQ